VEEVPVSASLSVPAADVWGGHQLLMSGQDDSTNLAQWAAHGLDRGDKLLYAADERHPDETSLAVTLGGYGVDAAGAAADGRLAVVDPARFYDLEGYERLVEQGLRDGHGGVRSFGGPEVAAGVLDAAGFAEFEGLLDRLWVTHGATALCCYAAAGGALHLAIRRHPSGWGQHLLHVHHRDHGRWGVHGEIDSSNDELFATLLAAAADRAAVDGTEQAGVGEECERGPLLVLDCTGLDYSGVAAWRAAVVGTEAFRARGGRVALTGLRPHSVRILRMTGFAAVFDLPASGDER
jgi:anti-anti-sigma regulatory factor